MTPEEKELREKEDQGLVKHRDQWVDAEMLEEIQKQLERVFQVDPALTLDELKKLLRPAAKTGSVLNWK